MVGVSRSINLRSEGFGDDLAHMDFPPVVQRCAFPANDAVFEEEDDGRAKVEATDFCAFRVVQVIGAVVIVVVVVAIKDDAVPHGFDAADVQCTNHNKSHNNDKPILLNLSHEISYKIRSQCIEYSRSVKRRYRNHIESKKAQINKHKSLKHDADQ